MWVGIFCVPCEEDMVFKRAGRLGSFYNYHWSSGNFAIGTCCAFAVTTWRRYAYKIQLASVTLRIIKWPLTSWARSNWLESEPQGPRFKQAWEAIESKEQQWQRQGGPWVAPCHTMPQSCLCKHRFMHGNLLPLWPLEPWASVPQQCLHKHGFTCGNLFPLLALGHGN